MAFHEIDSFINKFKALCQGGRNASLTLSSKFGKAVINLRVDLGVPFQQDLQPHHPQKQHCRNGPAQQRRRERRAAACQATAEEAEAMLSLEEKEMVEMAETDKSNQVAEQADDTLNSTDDTEEVTILEVVNKSVEEIKDEFVPVYEYESLTVSTQNEENPRKEPPPPVRDRTLGGIDYYSLSYDDPIFKNGYY
jgi:hypothetical protein